MQRHMPVYGAILLFISGLCLLHLVECFNIRRKESIEHGVAERSSLHRHSKVPRSHIKLNETVIAFNSPSTEHGNPQVTPHTADYLEQVLQNKNPDASEAFPPFYESAENETYSYQSLKECNAFDSYDACTKHPQCFHDAAYNKCFAKCALMEQVDRCEEVVECRFDILFSTGRCINDGYQSYSFTSPLKGFKRGCPFFLKRNACLSMEKGIIPDEVGTSKKRSGLMRAPPEYPRFSCSWSTGEETDHHFGNHSVCVDNYRIPSASKLKEINSAIAEEAREEGARVMSDARSPLFCDKQEISNARISPEKELYEQSDKISVTCHDGYTRLSHSKLSSCRNGHFSPPIHCLPTNKLEETEVSYLNRVHRAAERQSKK